MENKNWEILLQYIFNHKKLMEIGLVSTKRILDAAKSGQVDIASEESENRERLVSVMAKIQGHIEQELTGQPKFSREIIIAIKNWNKEFNQWVEDINNIDQVIVNLLSENKDKINQEIGTIFKNRINFKGYDLSNIKK